MPLILLTPKCRKCHFGRSFSLCMNEFCKKSGWPCSVFFIFWLCLLELNLIHKQGLYYTWASLTNKAYKIHILINFNFRINLKIEWFMAIRSLAFSTWGSEITNFRFTDDFHPSLCCLLWFKHTIRRNWSLCVYLIINMNFFYNHFKNLTKFMEILQLIMDTILHLLKM
jgi:hypothetical protein